MELSELVCPVCGAELKRQGEVWYCNACGHRFKEDTLQKEKDAVAILFEEGKREQLANARKNLHRIASERDVDAADVTYWARRVKELFPEDLLANFYEAVCNPSVAVFTSFLSGMDEKKYADYLDDVFRFLLKCLSSENLLAVSAFLERCFQFDPVKYKEVQTLYEEEAKKIEEGVYDVSLPRDVFVAYKSEDREKMLALVDHLEQNGLTCFVALRNLQHGKDAPRLYDEKLEKAMDSCRVVVFVSSRISRTKGDARNKELRYIRQKDFEGAPGEYRTRNDYANLPRKYKKPRVEYVIEPYMGTSAEWVIREFFDGCERCGTPEEVYAAVEKALLAPYEAEEERRRQEEAKRQEEERRAEAERRVKAEYEKKFAAMQQELAAAQKAAEEARRAEEERRRREMGTSGLEFTWNEKKTGYIVKVGSAKNATQIVIPATYQGIPVVEIGEEAFEYCYSLTSITIPDSVTLIGQFAFCDCSSLTMITIPRGLTLIGWGAFAYCAALEHLTVEKGNKTYYSENNCIIERATKKLVLGGKNSVIPNGVVSIGDYAFHGRDSLTSITIPGSVTSIGNCVFGDCAALEHLTVEKGNQFYYSKNDCIIERATKKLALGCKNSVIPNDVTAIGDYAFFDCASLVDITIPRSVTSIGANAFACTSLTSITIPRSVTSIGEWAFNSCESLTSITIPSNVTLIEESAFDDCGSLKTVIYLGTTRKWQKIKIGPYNTPLTKAQIICKG